MISKLVQFVNDVCFLTYRMFACKYLVVMQHSFSGLSHPSSLELCLLTQFRWEWINNSTTRKYIRTFEFNLEVSGVIRFNHGVRFYQWLRCYKPLSFTYTWKLFYEKRLHCYSNFCCSFKRSWREAMFSVKWYLKRATQMLPYNFWLVLKLVDIRKKIFYLNLNIFISNLVYFSIKFWSAYFFIGILSIS